MEYLNHSNLVFCELDSVKWPVHNPLNIFMVEHQSLTTLISAQPSAAGVLHQSFATVAPPVTAQTTAAPHQEPGRPERGAYKVNGSNGTTCLLASMGLQLDVTYITVQSKVRRKQKLETDVQVLCTWVGLKSLSFLWPAQTRQQVVNIQPNVTNSTGSCDADSATLILTSTDKTNLTFVFTLVRYVYGPAASSSRPSPYELLFIDRSMTFIFTVQFH